MKKHSISKSIILHLLPGLLTGFIYFIVVPTLRRAGFPSVLALVVAGVIVLIPFELGCLFSQKKKTGLPFFNGIVRYCSRIPLWQYFVWVPVTIFITGISFYLFGFTVDYLRQLFDWIPADLILDMGLSNDYSKEKLIIAYSFLFLFLVLIIPIVEEFYFRGYLLPRMPENFKCPQLFHSALFAIYHTWTPWQIIVRTIGGLPLICIVKKKENIFIGVFIHCLLNMIDVIIGVLYIINLH